MSEEKLRVWWIPQVPMTGFHVHVESVEDAMLILKVLADYDLFLLKHRLRRNFSNGGGLEVFDTKDTTDSTSGSWVEWYNAAGGHIQEIMGEAT